MAPAGSGWQKKGSGHISLSGKCESTHEGQVAVEPVVVQAVADHELIGDVESDVGDIDRIPRRLGLSEYRQTFRLAGPRERRLLTR